MLTPIGEYGIIHIVVSDTEQTTLKCASGSAVEHLLAKEGVAGSIPVSRFFYCKRASPSEIPFFAIEKRSFSNPLIA